MIQFNRGKFSTSRDQESVGISMEIQKQFVLIWQKEEDTLFFLAQTYVNSSILCLNIVSRDVHHLEIL